ncbi:hypothetical protein EDD21DRAFT_365924 [Dissophora ornata]|nr:hypothetical protein EDD21DRAFT_365924 [Dissophora ornata]
MTAAVDSTAEEQETCRLCPQCKPETGTWVCCDVCETWYHVRCLKMSIEEFETIDQYHCSDCVPKAGPSTLLRKSSRRTGKINYADLVNGVVSHRSKWRVLLDSHQFLPDKFERIEGQELTLDRLRLTGFKHPVVVNMDQDGTTTGLDMKLPPETLTVDDVRDGVGADTPVEVIDVATQSELLDWDMGAWADYFKTEPKERVYNVISLEISGTPLADQVQRPRVVRELDWIENFWPKLLQGTEFPKVQLYCLMSVEDSFTDFHIDFAGSSVFYHILSGSKTFFFVEPTSTHLRKYAKWSSSADQSTTFFGDEVGGKCYKVELKQGDTMLIPAGWIHAVYTPSSSVVIGGNFIHSLHIPMQYRISDIEIETNVSPKFRFPYFEKLNWFVALGCMKRGFEYLSSLSDTELRGLLALTVHLYNRQRSLKRDPQLTKDERYMIRASIPAEASGYVNGGSVGLLRDLNQAIRRVLEEQSIHSTAYVPIDASLRLPTEEEEEEQAEQEGKLTDKSKPKIKLRIKLSSTTSSTNSGDDESSTQGEQRVPTSAPPTAPPKLTFKLPVLSSVAKSKKRSGRATKKIKVPVADMFESASRLDGDSSDMEVGQSLTSDEEWTEFENQVDEGFDEAKEDYDEAEMTDDGGLLELRSSDSEYDGSESRVTKRARRYQKGSAKTTVAVATATYISRSSSETIYFDDGGYSGDGAPDSLGSKARVESDEEGEVVLGLGRKRKMTPLQFSKLIASSTAPSLTSATVSSAATTTASRKKSTSGGTARDRIKSLLMKRR